jgi:FKBP-type peptidyl-prolyl cis-trans isomerase SlyD
VTERQLCVADDHVVSIQYRLTDDAGEVIDESGESPLEYLHGKGNIVPGLERALAGKTVGFEETIVVAPEEAYGVRDERGVSAVPRGAFPPDAELEPGMQLVAQAPDGARALLWVREVSDDEVVVDQNHPLAGVALHFDIKLVGIRPATEQELSHQHAHGSGGCGGHGGGHGECCGGKMHDEQDDCAQDGSCCGGHGHGHAN